MYKPKRLLREERPIPNTVKHVCVGMSSMAIALMVLCLVLEGWFPRINWNAYIVALGSLAAVAWFVIAKRHIRCGDMAFGAVLVVVALLAATIFSLSLRLREQNPVPFDHRPPGQYTISTPTDAKLSANDMVSLLSVAQMVTADGTYIAPPAAQADGGCPD